MNKTKLPQFTWAPWTPRTARLCDEHLAMHSQIEHKTKSWDERAAMLSIKDYFQRSKSTGGHMTDEGRRAHMKMKSQFSRCRPHCESDHILDYVIPAETSQCSWCSELSIHLGICDDCTPTLKICKSRAEYQDDFGAFKKPPQKVVLKENPLASATRDIRYHVSDTERAAAPASSSSSSSYHHHRSRSEYSRGPYGRYRDSWNDSEPWDRARWSRPEIDDQWLQPQTTTERQQTESYGDYYDRSSYDTWYSGDQQPPQEPPQERWPWRYDGPDEDSP